MDETPTQRFIREAVEMFRELERQQCVAGRRDRGEPEIGFPPEGVLLIDKCREYMKKLWDEERLEFWRAICEGHCRECGRVLEASERRCHCTNDD